MAQILFIGEDTIKERTVLNGALDGKYLQQVIWTTQEEHIHTALGTKLYRKLLDGIENNQLLDEERELLASYITNAMIFFVMAELPYALRFKFTNKNILSQNTEGADAASMTDLFQMMQHYKTKAEFFLERMKRYIIQKNTESKLMEYINVDGKIDSLLPDHRSYKSQFLLEDDGLPGVDLGYGEGIKRLR